MANGDRRPLGLELRAVLLLAAVFAAGAVTGAAIHRWGALSRGPGEPRHHGPPPLPMLVAELDLTGEQRAQVDAVMARYAPEFEAVIRATFPQIRAIEARMTEEVLPLLTDEQRAELQRLQVTATVLGRRPPPMRGGPPPFGPGRMTPGGEWPTPFPPAPDGGPGAPPLPPHLPGPPSSGATAPSAPAPTTSAEP